MLAAGSKFALLELPFHIQYPCSSLTLVLCDEMNKEGQRGQRKITCYAWMTLAVVGHNKTQSAMYRVQTKHICTIMI